jgi:hypothetical protein
MFEFGTERRLVRCNKFGSDVEDSGHTYGDPCKCGDPTRMTHSVRTILL